MNEERMLQGAAIAEEIAKSFDDDAITQDEWLLIYTGLLASFAGALALRIGTERASQVLDSVKGSLPQHGRGDITTRH